MAEAEPPVSGSERERAGRGAGILLVLGAAVCWSLSGVGIKLLRADALAITGARALFAMPVFFAALWWRSRAVGLGPALRYLLPRKEVWLAALCYAWTVTSFVVANQLTTAANAILLQYTAPIYVVLLSWPLLGERVRTADVVAVLGCIGGMLALFLDQLSAAGALGNLVAMASGLGLGLVPLMLRRAERPDTSGAAADASERALLLGNLLTVLVGLPFLLRTPSLPIESWGILLGLGTVQIGAAYVLYAAAVRRLRPLECLMIASLEPILNPTWVALATGERPGPSALLGGGVIIGTVLLHALYVESRRLRARPA
jgi:drug/metabolite transporter (DMT)-like permease